MIRGRCALLVVVCLALSARLEAQEVSASETPARTASDAAAEGRQRFAEGRVEEARIAYEHALELAAPSERPVLLFDVATCLFELERWDDARERFLEAAATDPSLADLARLHAALAALHAGDLAMAEHLLELTPPTTDAETEDVRAALLERLELRRTEAAATSEREAAESARLDALAAPPLATSTSTRGDENLRMLPGVHGTLGLHAGWDSNPAQSGGAATTTLTGYASSASAPFVFADATLGYAARVSSKSDARVRYVGDWVALATSASQGLSTMTHGLEAQLEVRVHDRFRFRPGVQGSCSWLGMRHPIPWLCSGLASLRLDTERGARGARLEIQLGGQSGLEPYTYLRGALFGADGSSRWLIRRTRIDLGLRARWLHLGTLERALTMGSFLACDARCQGATYRIPVGYAELAPHLDVAVALRARLTLRSRLSIEARRYERSSVIDRIPESSKRRIDLRARAGLRVERTLDESGRARATLDLDALASTSNVAFDAADPAHRFDYNDRRFVQAVVSVGVELER